MALAVGYGGIFFSFLFLHGGEDFFSEIFFLYIVEDHIFFLNENLHKTLFKAASQGGAPVNIFNGICFAIHSIRSESLWNFR